jgi:TolB-like protein
MDYIHQSRTIQKRLVNEFDGRWLKEMGDGAMCTFQSASDAVYCALEIQEHLQEHDLQLRIGIHLGEVLIENGDIFSEGVNIASRLQAIAEPGGIYMSESVQKAVRGQSDIKTLYLGELQLKNVDYAIKTYALKGEGLPPVINGAAKRLSGRIWAEVKHRYLHRAGFIYLLVSLILLSLIPVVPIMQLFHFELIGLLSLGFAAAMILAWKYERSPGGFIRVTSAESWVNPFPDFRKKPLTSNLMIMMLIIVLTGINAFTLLDESENLSRPNTRERSIAVLPFDNFSLEDEQNYYGNCIQEDILTQLAKNPQLDVKSRTSTLPYKGQQVKSVEEIGKELKTNHILEGSVRQIGNRLRVTAQLINVTTDSNIWSKVYESELTDTIKVQHDIAASIAKFVSDRLVHNSAIRLSGSTDNLIRNNRFAAPPGTVRQKLRG